MPVPRISISIDDSFTISNPPLTSPTAFLSDINLDIAIGHIVLISDKDAFISASGGPKKDYIERKISNELEKIMDDRKTVLLGEGGDKIIPLHNDDDGAEEKYVSQVISPIIAEGDAIGAVVILSKQAGEKLGELEIKLAETASAFLGKQMEQ